MPWVELDDNDPGRLDMAIRAALHLCWTQMPAPRQTVQHVTAVFRHHVERALDDLREDADFFDPDLLSGAAETGETVALQPADARTSLAPVRGEPI